MMCVFFFKQKTAYEMRISDWSSDVCSSDLCRLRFGVEALHPIERAGRVGKLADAVVERALALADAAEIEPRRGETATLEGLVALEDIPVVHRAARGGMRVEGQLNRAGQVPKGGGSTKDEVQGERGRGMREEGG